MFRLLGPIVVLAALMTACGSGDASVSGSADPATGLGDAAATEWTLVTGEHNGQPVPIVAGADITLTIDGDQLNGQAACNSYFGSVDLSDGFFIPGPMGATKMACAPDAMASESAYLEAIAAVDAAAIEGSQLTLTGPSTNLVFEQRDASVSSSDEPPVIGIDVAPPNEWTLVSGEHNGQPIPIVAGADITLTIDGDQLNGRAACNSYFGSVDLTDDFFVPSGLGQTEMACAPEIMDSEFAYLSALSEVESATIENGTLTLSSPTVALVFAQTVS